MLIRPWGVFNVFKPCLDSIEPTSGKTHTFVLDFVNNPEDVQESFQRFYQSTILDGETDPNRLYDLTREIYDFHLYTKEDVNRFCEVFFDPDRDEGSLHPILDSVVDKFQED
jgi:type I restriction enzyme R subunit